MDHGSLTTAEAAVRADCCERTIRRWILKGALAATTVLVRGHCAWRVDSEVLDTLLREAPYRRRLGWKTLKKVQKPPPTLELVGMRPDVEPMQTEERYDVGEQFGKEGAFDAPDNPSGVKNSITQLCQSVLDAVYHKASFLITKL
jgi:hypothetical protein